MRSSVLAPLLFIGLLFACTPSDPCVCGPDEYCCFGTCQAAGTVCGPTDAGADATLSGDTSHDTSVDAPLNPCAARGDLTISFVCDGAVLVQCNEGEAFRTSTCEAPQRCEEFEAAYTDGAGIEQIVQMARCFDPSEAPCTAAEVGSRCDGDAVVRCLDNTSSSPPYWEDTEDCAERYPGGTCVVDEGMARCDVPSAEACDPAVYFGACEPDGAGYASCDLNVRRVLHEDCWAGPVGIYPGPVCFDSPESRAARVRICLPPTATPVDEPPTTPERWLGCMGDDVRARGYGYEYVRDCPVTISGGVVMPQACYELSGGRVECRAPGLVRCDPDVTSPMCIGASMSRTCDGLVTDEICGWRSGDAYVTTPCDVDSGRCVSLVGPGTGCDPSGADFCVDAPGTTEPRYLARCDPAGFMGLFGRPVALERCATECVPGAPDATCR